MKLIWQKWFFHFYKSVFAVQVWGWQIAAPTITPIAIRTVSLDICRPKDMKLEGAFSHAPDRLEQAAKSRALDSSSLQLSWREWSTWSTLGLSHKLCLLRELPVRGKVSFGRLECHIDKAECHLGNLEKHVESAATFRCPCTCSAMDWHWYFVSIKNRQCNRCIRFKSHLYQLCNTATTALLLH